MRFYLLVIFCVISSFLKAQNADKPVIDTEADVNLLSKNETNPIENYSSLLNTYDLNRDKILDANEKKRVLDLSIDGNIDLNSLLEFSNLKYLSLKSTNFTDLNLTSLKSLMGLTLTSNIKLEYLHIDSLNQLNSLKISASPIKQLDFTSISNINELFFYECDLDSLNLNPLKRIQKLTILRSKLREVKIDSLINLVHLHLDANFLTEIILPKSQSLKDLSLVDNQIKNIDLTKTLSLVKLDLSDNKLIQIDISNLMKLQYLGLGTNRLTRFKIDNNPELGKVFLEKNRLTELDLSNWIGSVDYRVGNPQILYIHHNQIKKINTKNGYLTMIICDKESIQKIESVIKDDIDKITPNENF